MYDSPIVPVILCGGSGTRLWPRSRATKPKPFLPLVGDTTLFEATLARCAPEAGFAPPVVVTGAAHVAHIEAQLADPAGSQVIVEPSARNTAAAIALAALRLPADAVMLVCPSDHHIADVGAFRRAAIAAADLARQGWLVSIGIEATAPETGFGYLQRGEALGDRGFRTARFVEKPDLARAQQFIAAGTYAWNGGIFAFPAGGFLRELAAHAPAILDAARAAVEAGRCDGYLFFPAAESFAEAPSISVDYAVMEPTAHKAMVLAEMGWSDIGSWDALHGALPRDTAGNSCKGRAELVDCRNVLVDSDGPRVSAIGLEDVVIVVDGDEVLVTTHAGAQLVGKLAGSANQ
jgi:mannose-1-phosphate guanylyltransferase/mannose-1-phosphate guanylyltransferase/mannose-6-phosphate isomerase